MQEDIERRAVAITIQGTKLTGKVLSKAIAWAYRKMQEKRHTAEVGDNSLKKLAGKDGAANTIEVTGRIKSFERIARKYQVKYHIEKDKGVSPPKWTIYFKAPQADMLTEAFKEYTRKEMKRDSRPSLLEQLNRFKEIAKNIGPKIKEKVHGGPEL